MQSRCRPTRRPETFRRLLGVPVPSLGVFSALEVVMKKLLSATSAVALALLLSACGGSDEGIIVDEHEPSPSGASATVTVTGAGDATLNGVYASSNVSLNNVTKVNPIGGEPET